MAHYEVITQNADDFIFSQPYTHPEALRFLGAVKEQGLHGFVAKVFEPQELAEMGCSGRGYVQES